MMHTLELHIKGMVCPRCETVIRQELERLDVAVVSIRLGYATVEAPSSVDRSSIARQLRPHGFELLTDPEEQRLEQIRAAVFDYLRLQEAAASRGASVPALSHFLAQKVGRNYSYQSKLFSTREGRTLEHYYIHLRIERVKELLDDNERNVSEIAHQLGYSSSHYLSAQFKKVTGQSISDYRKNTRDSGRNYLNQI